MYKFFSLFLVIVAIGCNTSPSLQEDTSITPRDVSITKDLAYNDLLLDSAYMEKFMAESGLNDTLVRRIRSFYNARNYQFAWFTSTGLTEQGKGFWNLQEYINAYTPDTIRISGELTKTMDRFYTDERMTLSSQQNELRKTELYLTRLLMEYAINNIKEGYIDRQAIESFIPQRKEKVLVLAKKYIDANKERGKQYSDINPMYQKLLEPIEQYAEIVENGGWPVVTGKSTDFKVGTSNEHIQSLIQRLRIGGYISSSDSINTYNNEVEEALKKFATQHGFTPDGKVTQPILQEMNITAETRLKQLIINLDRSQWMIQQPKGKLLVVNIPEFVLHVKEGNKDVFKMDVVVGKEAHSTTIFTGDLNQVVFSPYWNIPSSIVQSEILPAMQRNKKYLSQKNMEIVNNNGNIPVIRQLPGASNSLGKVKFLFPNKFSIYFHDTPAKDLFAKDQRAFSHGCIRLAEPAKLASWLLKDMDGWNDQKINTAMNSNTEQIVELKNNVPVLITYYTAWVDENNILRFAKDIYGHDEAMMQRRFL